MGQDLDDARHEMSIRKKTTISQSSCLSPQGKQASNFRALTLGIVYELCKRQANVTKIHAALTSAIQTNVSSIKRLCYVSNKPRSLLDQEVESQLTHESSQA